jgi:hypothetical protein
MSYAILRTEKHSSKSSISKSGAHTHRLQETPNANPEIENIQYAGSKNIVEDVYNFIDEKELKICKNGQNRSVISVEFLLTASPEFFLDKNGNRDEDKTKTFLVASHLFLSDRYGEKLVSSVGHLDEKTPHLTAHVVPENEETGRLSAKKIITGSSAQLSKLQDDFHKHCREMGLDLERGVRGSKATHQDVQRWYSEQKDIDGKSYTALNPVLEVPEPSKFESSKKYAENVNKALKEDVTALAQKATRAIESKNNRLSLEVRRANRAERNAQKQEKENLELKAQIAELREKPLSLVLSDLNYKALNKKMTDFRTPVGKISIAGEKWFNHSQGAGGGGAIDLIMHIESCDFKNALRRLGDVNIKAAAKSAGEYRRQQVLSTNLKEHDHFVAPENNEQKWQKTRDYLVNERKLDAKLIDRMHESGEIYSDDLQNAIFIMKDAQNAVRGADKRGTWGEYKGLHGITSKDSFFRVKMGDAKKVVYVESAIDALSYSMLNKDFDGEIISTSGARSAFNDICDKRDSDYEIIVAYDSDKVGQNHATDLHLNYGATIEKPENTKDWNEQVQLNALAQELTASENDRREEDRRKDRRRSSSKLEI